MSFEVELGGVVLPLNPSQLEANRLLEVADPLLARLLAFLTAVVTAEIQTCLASITGLPQALQKAVVKSIPGDPQRFIKSLKSSDFPILSLFRGPQTSLPWVIGNDKERTLWYADYVLPELEQYQLGSVLGLDNAVKIAIKNALENGQHDAYGPYSILEGTNVELLKYEGADGANWQWIDDKAPDKTINYPAVRVQFSTIELPFEYATNPIPFSGARITQQLLDDAGTEGSEVDFITSEITGLDD